MENVTIPASQASQASQAMSASDPITMCESESAERTMPGVYKGMGGATAGAETVPPSMYSSAAGAEVYVSALAALSAERFIESWYVSKDSTPDESRW